MSLQHQSELFQYRSRFSSYISVKLCPRLFSAYQVWVATVYPFNTEGDTSYYIVHLTMKILNSCTKPSYGDMGILFHPVINTLRRRQHGRHFADDTFKRIFLNENGMILVKISLKFVPNGPINNIPALVQIMAWPRPGDTPLSEAMMVSLLTHIHVTRPQWVKYSTGMNTVDMNANDHLWIWL